MLKTFEALKDVAKVNITKVSIDNFVFKLHYRFTCLIFLVSCVLVTSQQYIGEHIKCLTTAEKDSKSLPEKVVNTFCFFTSTYTVVKHLNASSLGKGLIPHPGVGPTAFVNDEPIIRHAYYQWVPFVLFLQGVMFYAPHFLWKIKEGGRLKILVVGLRWASFSFQNKKQKVESAEIPSIDDKKVHFQRIRREFMCKIHNKPWTYWLIVCELLNLVNFICNLYITNAFLGGNFFKLGPNVWRYGFESDVDILDEVFPKVTKCDFYKYGYSGTIQKHDALCVMALNIINEKIYTFLWFWFLFLGIFTIGGLLWRIITFIMHDKSNGFNAFVFGQVMSVKLKPMKIVTVTRQSHFADWLFLYYLAKNMDGFVFTELFRELAGDVDSEKVKPAYEEPANIPLMDKT